MKKYFLIVILFLLALTKTEAQVEYHLNDAIEFYRSQKMTSGEFRNVLTEKDIAGSPYLNDTFISGSVYTVSKTQYSGIPLRYNIFNDEIEFETPDKKVVALGVPEIVEKVTFGDYTMEYIPYEIANKVRKGFFEVILKGKASLYARADIQFVDAKKPVPYQEAEPARFIRKDDRYYIRIGMEAALSTGSKKDVIGIFPDHTNEIETFIKKSKINIRKEEDLKSLVEYYNSL